MKTTINSTARLTVGAALMGALLCLLSASTIHSGRAPASPLRSHDSLMSRCSDCSRFLPQLLQTSAARADDVSFDGETDHALCNEMGGEFEESCHTVADAFGLHNVDDLLSASPDLLCASMEHCEDQAVQMGYFDEDEDALLEDDQTGTDSDGNGASSLVSGLIEGALGTADKTAAKASTAAKAGDKSKAATMAELTAELTGSASDAAAQQAGAATEATVGAGSIGGLMKQRQMMQMKMQQQQMMQMQMMRMRMMSIMSSNREMKSRMRHMRRHVPGNCDCCQACPPPAAFGRRVA